MSSWLFCVFDVCVCMCEKERARERERVVVGEDEKGVARGDRRDILVRCRYIIRIIILKQGAQPNIPRNHAHQHDATSATLKRVVHRGCAARIGRCSKHIRMAFLYPRTIPYTLLYVTVSSTCTQLNLRKRREKRKRPEK